MLVLILRNLFAVGGETAMTCVQTKVMHSPAQS